MNKSKLVDQGMMNETVEEEGAATHQGPDQGDYGMPEQRVMVCRLGTNPYTAGDVAPSGTGHGGLDIGRTYDQDTGGNRDNRRGTARQASTVRG
jgi:hypothetical protein